MNHKVVINVCHGGFELSDEAMFALKQLGVKFDESLRGSELPRHLPELVHVVEELGDEGAARFPMSQLKVVSITGNEYWIKDFDGWEAVFDLYYDDDFERRDQNHEFPVFSYIDVGEIITIK